VNQWEKMIMNCTLSKRVDVIMVCFKVHKFSNVHICGTVKFKDMHRSLLVLTLSILTICPSASEETGRQLSETVHRVCAQLHTRTTFLWVTHRLPDHLSLFCHALSFITSGKWVLNFFTFYSCGILTKDCSSFDVTVGGLNLKNWTHKGLKMFMV
jgi:hypothetical protein